MNTATIPEKKTKKTSKKAPEPKVEMKQEAPQVVETTPVEALVAETQSEEVTANDSFFTLMETINDQMMNLQSLLSNVNVQTIDAKRFMDTRKKFDKSIMSFNASTLEIFSNALKTVTKNSTKKNKKNTENNSSKDASAVKQKLKAKKCLHDFLGKDNLDEEFSRNDAYTGVTGFIRELRQNDPASISVENGTNKEFKVTGKLKTFISNITTIVKEKTKIIEKEVKLLESNKPSIDSKEAREIDNMRIELDKLKNKSTVPPKMAFTDIMGFTNHCFVMSSDEVILKAKATKPKPKK